MSTTMSQTEEKGSGIISALVDEVKSNSGFYKALGIGALATVGVVAGAKLYAESTRNKHKVTTPTRITGIWVYPIKGCAGIKVEKLAMEGQGMAQDRQFILIRDKKRIDGSTDWLSARCTPKIVLIQPKIMSPSVGDSTGDSVLVLTSEGHKDIIVPKPGATSGAATYDLNVWMKWGVGEDCGDEVAAWLQAVLDEPDIRLARLRQARICDHPKFARNNETLGEVTTRFHDSYPLTVVSQGTINRTAEQCKMTGEEVIMRFRPNIIVDAMEPWCEDEWISMDSLDFGMDPMNLERFESSENDNPKTCSSVDTRKRPHIVLKTFKPCARCNVPMVNPYTADTEFDPMSVIGAYRSGRALMKNPDSLWAPFYEKQKTSSFWSIAMGIFPNCPDPKFNVGDVFVANSEAYV